MIQKAEMEFGGAKIHSVTDSDVVKYGNTNVKDILDNLLSYSSFMNSLLACTDANQVKNVPGVYSDSFYDGCGNKCQIAKGTHFELRKRFVSLSLSTIPSHNSDFYSDKRQCFIFILSPCFKQNS